jgi:RimJ/RimL family protein N-acetyltransferase
VVPIHLRRPTTGSGCKSSLSNTLDRATGVADFLRIASAALGSQPSENSAEDIIKNARSAFDRPNRQFDPFYFFSSKYHSQLIFTIRQKGVTVGFIGLQKDPVLFELLSGAKPDGQKWLFMWIALSPQARGAGYASEAVTEVLHFAFQVVVADGVLWSYEAGNSKSVALVERLQFQAETSPGGIPFFSMRRDLFTKYRRP